MPKLSPLQWLIVAVFQIFYGFAVFALTRDYFQRRLATPQAAAQALPPIVAPRPRANPAPSGEFDGDSLIPESVVRQDPKLLAQLGDERFGQRRYQEAIDIYRRVLEMTPDDVDTYNDLGLALHYSGDSTQALGVLKKGVEKNPRFQRIWLTLGFVQMHTVERPEAEFALQEAVKLGADNQIGQEAKRLLGHVSAP